MSSSGTHNIQTMHSKGIVVEVMQKSNMYDKLFYVFIFVIPVSVSSFHQF